MTDGSLTKAALIKEVAYVAGLTKKRAEIIVDAVFGSIVETLHRGEKVELRGFGSFRLRRREPHRGRNPRTGDRVDVPSKRVAYFKPGKELRELINRAPGAARRTAVVRPAAVEPFSPTGGRCSSDSSGVTRVVSLCERRVKALARLLRAGPADTPLAPAAR